MEEKDLLLRKLHDLAEKSYKQNVYTYTTFLNPTQLEEYHLHEQDFAYIEGICYGGYEQAERQLIRFGSPAAFGYEEPYPVVLLHIAPLIDKFSEDLTHRDFLGALMNLGIERDLLGDLLLDGHSAYVFCLSHIVPFLCDNLDSVRHTHVKLCQVEALPGNLQPKMQEIDIIAASLRLDAVAAALTRHSRTQILEFFRTGKILVNGRVQENNSALLKPDDLLVIRGYGKFRFIRTGARTRKDRIYIHCQQYI